MSLEQELQLKKNLYRDNSPAHLLLEQIEELKNPEKYQSLNALEYFIIHNKLPEGIEGSNLYENYNKYFKEKTLLLNPFVLAVLYNNTDVVKFFMAQKELDV